jgi:hypothetical protein
MELDENTLQGKWETNTKGMDFFIINDAIFSKLCILGEDIEPCFEGAKVSAPNVSASFSKVDDTFKQTLFTMIQDLRTVLEGGQQVNNDVVENAVVEPQVEFSAEPVFEPVAEPEFEPETPAEPSFVASAEPEVEAPVVEGDPITEPVVVEPETVDPVVEPTAEPTVEEPIAEPAPSVEEQFTALQAEHTELQNNYSALETEFHALQERYSALETAHAELVEFKRQSDDAKKDEMISKFYMLTEEDKQDVIANKANYSVEDIEEKLSVICFRKKVNFELEDNSKNNNKIEQPAVTFNMSNLGASKPAWLQAVDNAKNN